MGPGNQWEFVEYYEEMLSGELLGSHPLCIEVAAAVGRPRSLLQILMLGCLVDFLPIKTAPVAIRERLGLESTGWSRMRMGGLKRAAPVGFRILPKCLTYYPESYRAEKFTRGWRE